MEQKKVLIVASVVSFIEWFNKENVDYLNKECECELHIACNFDYMEDTDEERTRAYIKKITNEGVILHNIHFVRSPFSCQNIDCYKQLKAIINANHFDLIHVHTPTVGILTRLVARKTRKQGTIVMYTCHGFHFHSAAPKKYWLMFYPMERMMSRFCDYIVTINKEDFKRAKTFYAPNVCYIPGVGVNINRIRDCKIDKKEYKRNIGVPEDCILILSIGEMIERKNHEVIIRALAKVENKNVYYAICGKGPLREHLGQLANELGIGERVRFLGFRKDIPELCNTADISAFPSRIEGLGLAGIEAMAAGIPLISSNVHGIKDYVINGKTGYALDPEEVDGFAKAISELVNNRKLRERMVMNCLDAVAPFEIDNALHVMWGIYNEILKK
ncbi:glycosyltransferase [Bacteroides sp. BFG-257]|uniref:glycosyltransferase n=1 Tax=Bacteroides TaxID=816 RepID=UPI001CC9472F|nr:MULTISPECIES: glycosyltransferase [Bacteroides]UBD67981.1 glycosyltransferase [Bacteroides cellulosilyticus]UVO96677.1 glycosyltransferase [Bacteroides sp. BFG-257]